MHHLGLAVLDPPADLVEDRSRRARARGAAHGGDDAVGAVAVAAVLDLDEPAGSVRLRQRRGAAGRSPSSRRSPSPNHPPVHGRRAASRDVVLEIGARAQARRHRRRHLLGGSHERLTRSSSSANCAAFKLTAQPATQHPLGALQRAADRLARFRLGLARDAAGVDHVQRRPRPRGFGVTGGEQGLAGEHRIGLGDLAAEELDGERRHGGRTLARPPWTMNRCCRSRLTPRSG